MSERWPAQPGVSCGNCVNSAHCIDDAACDIFERKERTMEATKQEMAQGTMYSAVSVIASIMLEGGAGGRCSSHCQHFGTVMHEKEVLGLCRLYGATLSVIRRASGTVEVHRCHACWEGEKLAKTINANPVQGEGDVQQE